MKSLETLPVRNLAVTALLATTYLSNALSFSPIAKRTAQSTLPPAIDIAPSQYWDGNDGPWSSFPLQAGSGSVDGLQDVRVMISTAGNAIWTIGSQGCPSGYVANCADSRGFLFLPNRSLTWVPNSLYQTGLEQNLGMETTGYAGFDVASLGWQNSPTVTDHHAIIFNLASSDYWLGIFGLDPTPTNFSTFTNPQTSFMQSLLDRNVIPSLSYGYTAGNQYRLNEVFGSLTLGGYDANRFVPNNVSFDFYTDISRNLLVYLHDITSDKGSPSNLLPDGSISIYIDSTVAEIWLPESACSAFEKAFGIKYNDDFGRYLITSAQREQLLKQSAEVTFTIGPKANGGETVNITLPYQAFDLQVSFPIVENPNTSYYFPLQRAANETQYTLGRTFLQEAYLIADYQRQNFSISACDWDQDKVQTNKTVTIMPPSASDSANGSSLSTAEKIALAVAATSVIIIMICLVVFFLKRRRTMEKRRLAEEAARYAERKLAHDNFDKSMISRPIGGELGGTGLYEVPWEPKPPAEIDSRMAPCNEVQAGQYLASGKYYRYSVNEMAGTTPIYEMPGGAPSPRQERRPDVPPK